MSRKKLKLKAKSAKLWSRFAGIITWDEVNKKEVELEEEISRINQDYCSLTFAAL